MVRKQVSAMINMKGIKGYFKFQQDSPFSVTELTVNLTNLQSKVGPYHVHLFPVPSLRNPLSSLCSNDNIGGHFNPFGLNITDPNYPQGPGSTHDRYEIGDLGTKHMSLAGLTEFEGLLPNCLIIRPVGRTFKICLTGFFVDECLPDSLLTVLLVPIIKDKTGKCQKF
uniref:Uncharacterized protein n=1 Tax=Periophthalmus magnuspinnatus TaxID=409849 RepID=A0A3B3ZFR3_9GOBI